MKTFTLTFCVSVEQSLSSSAVVSAVAKVLLLPCNVKYLGFGILGLLPKNDVANLQVWPP